MPRARTTRGKDGSAVGSLQPTMPRLLRSRKRERPASDKQCEKKGMQRAERLQRRQEKKEERESRDRGDGSPLKDPYDAPERVREDEGESRPASDELKRSTDGDGNDGAALPATGATTAIETTAPRPPFDASNVEHVARAKAVLSPSLPASEAQRTSFGVRSAEATAVMSAIGAMHDASPSGSAGGKCYVCGLPGTGKTHTVTLVADELARASNMQVVMINCMHLANRKSGSSGIASSSFSGSAPRGDGCTEIFDLLIEAIEAGRPGTRTGMAQHGTGRRCGVGGETELLRRLAMPPRRRQLIRVLIEQKTGQRPEPKEFHVRRRGQGILIVLDEMDALDHATLASLMSLPCGVVGIANSITLIERLVARFAGGKASSLHTAPGGVRNGGGAAPATITFATYDKEKLAHILEERLALLDFELLHPLAVRLATTRVAAHSGDVRRLLGAVSHAIDVAALDARTGDEDEDEDLTRADASGGPITIAHMSKALHALMANQTVKAIATLSNYQQIVLCAAVTKPTSEAEAGGTDSTVGVVSVGDLYARCRSLCERDLKVPPMTYTDYCSVLSSLSDTSMVCVLQASVGDCALVAPSIYTSNRRPKQQRRFGAGNFRGGKAAAVGRVVATMGGIGRNSRVALKVTHDDVAFALGGQRFFAGLLSRKDV